MNSILKTKKNEELGDLNQKLLSGMMNSICYNAKVKEVLRRYR